jgi:ABC-type lipoprotein export system ATPase subunit
MIIDMLRKQTEEGKTVLMVTHNENYIKYADIVYRISDGVVK